MRSLIVDFAAAAPRCGLCDGTDIRWVQLEPNPEDQRGRLLYAAIQHLLPSGAWDELECLACVTGPGPMTGVRVGVAATIGLARGAGLPVVPLTAWHLRVDPTRRDRQTIRFRVGRAGWSIGVVDTSESGWPVIDQRVEREGEHEDPLRDDATLAALATITPVDAAALRPIYLRPASADPQFDVFGRPLAGQAT